MIPEIVPLGDRALLVNFQQKINSMVHQQVLDLLSEIENQNISGVTFLQPAYCSLTIGFNPAYLKYSELKRMISELCQRPVEHVQASRRLVTLPVCYEEPYALDLKEISTSTGLDKNELVDLHTKPLYQVFMIGFLPGFPYLGVLPEKLRLPRLTTPRLQVPERSVGIAGLQTGIYPVSSPGGWNILGMTPVPVFNVYSDKPFLFKTGDQVKFKAIGNEEYQMTLEQIANDAFDWESLYG